LVPFSPFGWIILTLGLGGKFSPSLSINNLYSIILIGQNLNLLFAILDLPFLS